MNDRDAAKAAAFGFAAGVGWSVGLSTAVATPIPEPVWALVFVPLAAITLHWARGWKA